MDWDLDTAMMNSYNVIIRQYDPFLIIIYGESIFAHNPSEQLELYDVESVLAYFEAEEEYDKCREISDFIKEKWNLENIKQK